jgi:hypothetical protein
MTSPRFPPNRTKFTVQSISNAYPGSMITRNLQTVPITSSDLASVQTLFDLLMDSQPLPIFVCSREGNLAHISKMVPFVAVPSSNSRTTDISMCWHYPPGTRWLHTVSRWHHRLENVRYKQKITYART